MANLNGGFFATVRSVTGTPATATAMVITKSLTGITLPVYLRIRRPGIFPTDANSTVVAVTAATGASITAMTRNLTNGGLVNYPIQAGDEVYADLGFLIEQLRASVTSLTSGGGSRATGTSTGIVGTARDVLTAGGAVGATADALALGVNVTPTVDCYALVIATVDFLVDAGGAAGDLASLALVVNGATKLGKALTRVRAASDRPGTTSMQWMVPLTANTLYRMKLQALRETGAGSWSVVFDNTAITYQLLATGVTV